MNPTTTLRLLGATAAMLGATTLAAGPAFAATGTTFRYSTSGYGADAVFSTFPASGTPVAGTVYQDTFVTTATQATRLDGTAFTGSFVYLDVFSYSFDRKGVFHYGSDTFGVADGAAVSLTEDKQLNAATLKATVALQRCTETACSAAGTQAVDVSWTGVGDTAHNVGNFSSRSKSFSFSSHENGYYRNASATSPQFGSAQSASLNSGRFSDRYTCSGTAC